MSLVFLLEELSRYGEPIPTNLIGQKPVYDIIGDRNCDQKENQNLAESHFIGGNNDKGDPDSNLGQNQSQSQYCLLQKKGPIPLSKNRHESRFFKPTCSPRDPEIDSIDGEREMYGHGFSDELKVEIGRLFGHTDSIKPKIQKRPRPIIHRQKKRPMKKSMILSKNKTRLDQAFKAEMMEEHLLDWARTYVREKRQFKSGHPKQVGNASLSHQNYKRI